MCKPKWKKRLMAVLVLGFVVQTTLVYSDERSEPLSEAGLAGRVVWHREACQTCHQLYGQGGFLGPDLTNAASRVDPTRLVSLLQVGSGQMPALHLTDAEIADVSAFLSEIDRPDVGRGQLRLGSAEGGGLEGAFERAVSERLTGTRGEAAAGDGADDQASERASAGFRLFQSRPCAACHMPFRISPVGAPDLSTVVERLSADSISKVLASGRPLKGMPPPTPAFTAEERDAVIAYFTFLNTERAPLSERTEALEGERRLDWRHLPWWNFP